MVNILYLEDEVNIREVTMEYLKMKGYEVQAATDGKEALELLEQQTFDLAILDIMVPFVSGIEVLKVMSVEFPATKVIMLSALGDETHQLEAFNHHADDYIIKPFSPILLLKRIEAILRRGSQISNKTGIDISKESYQVFYQGKSIGLTVTEFVLFNALATNPNKVFSREDLLNVMDPDSLMVSDRVIDAHIKNLRKKLPFDYIKTVIGIGYQYKEQNHETIT